MSKFLSGRQSNLKLGVAGYTESKTVLETTGKVGIGTTDAQSYSLYVVGDANITGIVSATAFYGDGSNLENTGATLSAAAGTQRLVVTSLTSGTMVDAATDSDLTFDATTNTLNTDNLIVAGNLTVSGDQTILNTTQLEVEDINIGIASASSKLNDAQLDGAGITIHGSQGDKTLTWSNANSRMEFNTTLYAPRYVGVATDNIIPFLYNDYTNLPSAGTYHGAFAHVHNTQKAYFAHANAWYELVNKELNGIVGTGTESYNINNVQITGGISTDGTSYGLDGQLLKSTGTGWEWRTVPGIFSVNNILNGFNVLEEGGQVGTAGSIHTLDFRGINVFASGDPQPNGIATITFTPTPTFTGVNLTGVSTITGTITAGSSEGVNGQYLRHVGTGVTWASFPTLRVTQTNTATAGQTAFNFSYNVDFLDVFVNGVKLTSTEYTATNGNQIILNTPAFADEVVEFHSYNVTSNYSGGGGGGGASNLNGLSDVTIGTLADGQLLQYQSSSGEWENVNISSAGVVTSIVSNTSDIVSLSDSNGVVTIDVAVGAGGTWATDLVGINTVKNVGIGTTAKDDYKLYVEGDARVTGILTVGPASVTIDGVNNTVTANSFVGDLFGSVSGSGNSVSCTTVSVGGSVTANQLYGDGSNLTGVLKTHQSLVGKANVTIGDNPPGIGTASGDLWWESDTAKGHIYYDDGSSAQWVEFNPASGGGSGGGGGGSYANSDVDNHLNVATASAGEILSWNGSDYDWVSQSSGITTANINADTLNVSGISTFNNVKIVGSGSNIEFTSSSNSGSSQYMKFWVGNQSGTHYATIDGSGGAFQIHNTSHPTGTLDFRAKEDYSFQVNGYYSILNQSSGGVKLFHPGSQGNILSHKLETLGIGVTVVGTTFSNQLSVSGVCTASAFVGDGSGLTNLPSSGGISNVVEDTTPQLGGNLDLNGNNITGNGNITINGTASITGSSIQLIDNNNNDTYIKMTSGITSISHPAQSVYPQRIATTNQGIDIFKDVSIKDTTNTEKFNFNTGSGTLTADFFSGDGSNLTNVSAGATDLVSSYNLLNTSTTSAYFVDGPGITDTTDPNPTIYLTRGQTYKFNNNAGSHPFRIQYQHKLISGAVAYNDGIPNNQVGNGATLYWEVPFDAPDVLYYQCSSHINMSGKIVIMGDVVSEGSWTASAGTAQTIDTITGVANNAIKTAEYTIHIENGSNMQAQKVLVMQDGTTAFSQEYAIMHKSGLLVSISATISGGNLLLQATPETGVTGTTTYKVTRQTMR